jgi:predicted RNase H-like nuclease
MHRLYGVDGCRSGWVLAECDSTLQSLSFSIAQDLRPLFDRAGPDSLIAIDVPIGLAEREPRACDAQARSRLGWPRCTSVFSPPVRQVLHANTFAEALRINRKVGGTGISKQAFCIMPKIREVDALMNRDRQKYIREAHPELAFAQLNGSPMLHNKKTLPGRVERIATLKKAGLRISSERLTEERLRLGATRIAPDDLVDALACLVTAFHIHSGRSQSLGRTDQEDARGLLMEIVTCAQLPISQTVRRNDRG